MKKLTVLALIAMMLIGILAFAACQTETQEAQETIEEMAEDTEAAVDTMLDEADQAIDDMEEAAQEATE